MKNPLPSSEYLKRTIHKEYKLRGEYFRDQTAIIHSMPFRRLKHKTQVFFSPENDHVCTRIEHVMHVATISATICKGLSNFGWDLSTEMAYAIGLGHDLGHAPFGHAGEEAINEKLNGNGSFMHEIHSYRVVNKLSKAGTGLNLTYGVKDGIINHNGEKFERKLKPIAELNNLDNILTRNSKPSSYEGCIVRFSDKIAYLGRDIEDAIIAGFINKNDIPERIKKELGSTNGEIINNLVKDIIYFSKDKDSIGFSDNYFELLNELKNFNYEKIYNNKGILNYKIFCKNLIKEIFDHLIELMSINGIDYEKYNAENIQLNKWFGEYLKKMMPFYEKENSKPEQIVTDYVAGMTDDFALEAIKMIKIPSPIKFY